MNASTEPWSLQRIRDVCEVLPFASNFGVSLLEATPERAVARLTSSPLVARPEGVVAGPAVFTLADLVFYALAVAAWRDPSAVTSNLSVDFLRPAHCKHLEALAVPLRTGKRRMVAQIHVRDDQGRLVAHAGGAYVVPPRRDVIPPRRDDRQ